jgi:hypothetical protein
MKKSLIARSDALDERIESSPIDINKSIDALITASARNRRLINWVIVSIIFETVLAVAVIFTVIRTTTNGIRLDQTQNTLVSVCLSENKSNATQLTFWNYIITLSERQPQTPEGQQRIDAFNAKLNETFAARNCDKL